MVILPLFSLTFCQLYRKPRGQLQVFSYFCPQIYNRLFLKIASLEFEGYKLSLADNQHEVTL